LAASAADIKGRVLEFGDRAYTRKFGGNKVTQSDVWDIDAGNEAATVIGDLVTASHIPSNAFDCIVCTQTLGFIYDVNAAVKTIHRILNLEAFSY
jgi:Methyltransferase domain